MLTLSNTPHHQKSASQTPLPPPLADAHCLQAQRSTPAAASQPASQATPSSTTDQALPLIKDLFPPTAASQPLSLSLQPLYLQGFTAPPLSYDTLTAEAIQTKNNSQRQQSSLSAEHTRRRRRCCRRRRPSSRETVIAVASTRCSTSSSHEPPSQPSIHV